MRIISYNGMQLKDMMYAGVDVMTWSIVEQSIGIVCACLAIIRPLIWCSRIKTRRDKTHDSWSSCGMRSLIPINSKTLEDGLAANRSSYKSMRDSASIATFPESDDGQIRTVPAVIPQLCEDTIGVAITTNSVMDRRERLAVLSVVEEETKVDEYIDPRSNTLEGTSVDILHHTAYWAPEPYFPPGWVKGLGVSGNYF